MVVIPKKSFLLRVENGKEIVTERNRRIEVTEAEARRFKKNFLPVPETKKIS